MKQVRTRSKAASFYREQLRQLALPMGILLFVFLAVTLLTNSRDEAVRSVTAQAPFMLAYPYVAGVFAAIWMYGRYTRCNRCDYYYALPVARSKQFLLMAAAAATWFFVSIFSVLLLSVLLYWAQGLLLPVHLAQCGALLSMLFLTTLLTYAMAALGCGWGGTLFSQLCFAGTVLLLCYCLPVLPLLQLNALDVTLEWGALPLGAGDLFLSENAILSWGAHVARLVLTVLFGLWALRVFCKRPAELAGNACVKPAKQNILAALMVLPAWAVIASLLASSFFDDVTDTVCLVAFAMLLGWFVLFQCINYRSFKRMLTSLGWFCASIALATALGFGAYGVAQGIADWSPEAKQIVAIYDVQADSGNADYFALQAQDVNVATDAMRTLVAKQMNKSEWYSASTVRKLKVRTTSGLTLTKTVWFTNSTFDLYCDERAKCEAYSGIVAKPPLDEARSLVMTDGAFYPTADKETLYRAYLQQADMGSYDSAYTCVAVSSKDNPLYGYYGGLRVGGYVGLRKFSFVISLNANDNAALTELLLSMHNAENMARLQAEPFSDTFYPSLIRTVDTEQYLQSGGRYASLRTLLCEMTPVERLCDADVAVELTTRQADGTTGTLYLLLSATDAQLQRLTALVGY